MYPVFIYLFFSPPPSASLPAGPPPQISPDDAEQQAVHLLACSADMLPAPLPPISMFDLLEALQVRKIYIQLKLKVSNLEYKNMSLDLKAFLLLEIMSLQSLSSRVRS